MPSIVVKGQNGMTLVELMVVVVIVSVLTLVAVPSYRDFVKRSQRTEAKEALVHIANNQERFYLHNHTYASDLADLGFGREYTENGLYQLRIVAADRQGFSATAEVASGSGMETDFDCLQFGIDQAGERSATPDPAGKCW